MVSTPGEPLSHEVKRMKVGRNEPCPCESGKKYTHCCERKQARQAAFRDSLGKGLFWIFGPLAIIGIAVVSISALRGPDASGEPGRVWSTAHGHWHLVGPDGTEVEARPGLVWSEEQGRFVDTAPLTAAVRKHVTSDLDRRLGEAEANAAEANEPES